LALTPISAGASVMAGDGNLKSKARLTVSLK
jgi:hypothetical protein